MLQNVNNGCQAQGILFLLAINVLVSVGSAVLYTYMSYYSCSRVFQGAAGASYTFLLVNFALMAITKAWKQIVIQFIFLLHLFVFVTMVTTLSYSVIESFCGYNICIAGLNELEYYTWFNQQGIRDKIQVSCYDDINVIEQKFLEVVKLYQDEDTFVYGDQFSILYGWPISFAVFMMVLSMITIVVTYRAIFSCNGCNVTKSDFVKNYFSFSDDDEDDDDEN